MYAMAAQEWAVRQGYAPYASHLIQTTHAALELSNQIRIRMDVGLFFVDYGYSSGMHMAKELFEKAGKETEEVRLATAFPERFDKIERWVARRTASESHPVAE